MTDLTGQSTAALVRQAAEQISALARDEIRLARAEITEKGRHAARGAGMLGGAGLTALYGVAALITAAGLALALVMPGWAAALVVAAVLFIVAAIQAVAGRNQLKQVPPLAPSQAMESMQADLDTLGGKNG